MSWVRVDDKIAFHRKVVAAGNEAFGAWMRMTAWTADHLLDGRIPSGIAWAICGHGRECVLDTLVKVGLLDRDGEDFLVHDYCEYNPLAADVKAKRQADLDRKKGGKGTKKPVDSSSIIPRGIDSDSISPVPVPPSSLFSSPSASSSSVSDARARDLSLGEPESKKQQRLVDKHLPDALKILDELNAARSRVRPSSRGIRPTYSSLGGIAARLAAGRTVDECLTVVALGEAECAHKPDSDSFDYFDAISPWRPENFERRLARDPKRSGEEKRGNQKPRDHVEEGYDALEEFGT